MLQNLDQHANLLNESTASLQKVNDLHLEAENLMNEDIDYDSYDDEVEGNDLK